jgi:hypothetical protein
LISSKKWKFFLSWKMAMILSFCWLQISNWFHLNFRWEG